MPSMNPDGFEVKKTFILFTSCTVKKVTEFPGPGDGKNTNLFYSVVCDILFKDDVITVTLLLGANFMFPIVKLGKKSREG
jgi:hypothetical protein